ncbi:hypothetical protein AAT19DRAFT_10502 [Rhodotorula toruloides]|uniref:Uncharacterized protein n=1 Tax=Rhodotorula toruloides TaxID=5286 RepID=A0A2S9ZYX7_RHOTO|nr:hypothetical protein AAT19DRAFT_10502 [Rhodotorula toruloides]
MLPSQQVPRRPAQDPYRYSSASDDSESATSSVSAQHPAHHPLDAEEDGGEPVREDLQANDEAGRTQERAERRHDPVRLASPRPPQRTVSIDTAGERTCWICYATSTEEPNRPFIHACSCTLLAHPDCLLQWIQTQAAMQAQAPRCPVCATPIVIKEKRSEALRLYKKVRRNLDQVSLVAAVGSLAASGWFVAAAYGAWAIKVFFGDQVTQALLLRHENGLPWRYAVNLPLIPLTLVLSRTPLIDSLLPFLPLTLILSTHTHTPLFDPIGLDDLTLRWPPSPTLTVCLLPWLRIFYFRLRTKVFDAVLGKKKRFRGLAGVFEEAAEDELATVDTNEQPRREIMGVVATFELDVEAETARRAAAPTTQAEAATQPNGPQMDGQTEQHEDNAPAPPYAEIQPAQHEQDGEEQGVQPDLLRLRVGLGRLTSIVLGALLFPALSSLAGSALYFLASRHSSARPFRLLRRILGISADIAASRTSATASRAGSVLGLGWIRQLTSAGSALRAAPMDPRWVRNTIGAGLVLLVRDAFELTAGVLEKRRKDSRRIVERPFRPSSGATRASEPRRGSEGTAAATSSGGRDRQGREAVVHNFL